MGPARARPQVSVPWQWEACATRSVYPTDASGWLVNFDWGDNGFRHPFLDET